MVDEVWLFSELLPVGIDDEEVRLRLRELLVTQEDARVCIGGSTGMSTHFGGARTGSSLTAKWGKTSVLQPVSSLMVTRWNSISWGLMGDETSNRSPVSEIGDEPCRGDAGYEEGLPKTGLFSAMDESVKSSARKNLKRSVSVKCTSTTDASVSTLIGY